MRRTDQQFKAHWVYCQELADALNEKGVSQKIFLDKIQKYDVPLTKEFLHMIWLEIQRTMYGTTSTNDLKSDQVSQIYDVMNLFTSQEFHVGLLFGKPVDSEL